MIYCMKLKPEPFHAIKEGYKTIELRLNDEKRQKIQCGNYIEFSNLENPDEKILTQVINIHYFDSFEELYRSLSLLKCGYTSDTLSNADFSDMEKYYSKEKQAKYGVVGIEIQLADLPEGKVKTMNIRTMRIEDYEEVYALWLSCKGMGLNDLDDSKEGIKKFLKRNPKTCFVAVTEDNKIVGVIIVGNDGRRGYIYHTAVHPDHRHNGIASKLVNEAMTALKENGINKAALVVFERNSVGNAFWEKLGFTVRDDLVYRNLSLTDMIRIDT